MERMWRLRYPFSNQLADQLHTTLCATCLAGLQDATSKQKKQLLDKAENSIHETTLRFLTSPIVDLEDFLKNLPENDEPAALGRLLYRQLECRLWEICMGEEYGDSLQHAAGNLGHEPGRFDEQSKDRLREVRRILKLFQEYTRFEKDIRPYDDLPVEAWPGNQTEPEPLFEDRVRNQRFKDMLDLVPALPDAEQERRRRGLIILLFQAYWRLYSHGQDPAQRKESFDKALRTASIYGKAAFIQSCPDAGLPDNSQCQQIKVELDKSQPGLRDTLWAEELSQREKDINACFDSLFNLHGNKR